MIPAHGPRPIKDPNWRGITDQNKPPGLMTEPTETLDRSWSWGPRRKSSQHSGGWKTCQWASMGCNSSSVSSLFPVFHVNFVTLVGVVCHCLSMLGTILFMNWFIIWGLRRARLDRNQHCEVEIQHAEVHRDETSRASILQSPATSSRRTWSRNHLQLGRKRGICWFPIFWGKAGRSENLQSAKWTRHCSKKCSRKVSELAQWKNETTLWGKEFGNRSQRVVPSTRFDPHVGDDVCGTTVKTFFLPGSVPWETSLAPCHSRVYLWWRRGTGWNWFGKTLLFLKVGGLNACSNSSKSISLLENLSESRANQIEVRDCHDLPKFPRNHLVWTWLPSDEIDKSLKRSAGLS